MSDEKHDSDRQAGEDWFTWMVRLEAQHGSSDPILAAAVCESLFVKMDGAFPQ